MPSGDPASERDSCLDPVETLPRELREKLASEIEALPEFQTGKHGGRGGKSMAPRDADRIISLLQNTLREVVSRGGFIHDLPRRQARIEKLRDKIQLAKEDLTEMCEDMVTKLRALRWMGIAGSARPTRGTLGSQHPSGEEAALQLEQLQTELKNLRAQCRRRCEALLTMIHELAQEEENCDRLVEAASNREPTESLDPRRGITSLKGSPMVFRRKHLHSV